MEHRDASASNKDMVRINSFISYYRMLMKESESGLRGRKRLFRIIFLFLSNNFILFRPQAVTICFPLVLFKYKLVNRINLKLEFSILKDRDY